MTNTNMNAHYSSESSEWETPQNFFDRLDAEFAFTLDPCADRDNHKCVWCYTVDDNGLSKPWMGSVFMNPPYGRKIGEWVQKAYRESKKDYCRVVVGLLPSRTDTRWWHDWVMKAHEVRLVKGRLKFVGAKNSAPFPNAVVVWRGGYVQIPVFGVMNAREK